MTLREIFKSTTFFDRIVFFILLIIPLFIMIFVSRVIPGGNEVTVRINNELTYRLPLSENRTVNVDGVLIELKGSKVRVKEADCPKKICIKQGWIEKGSIICLPNRLVVSVERGSDTEDKGESNVDAITG